MQRHDVRLLQQLVQGFNQSESCLRGLRFHIGIIGHNSHPKSVLTNLRHPCANGAHADDSQRSSMEFSALK